MGCMTGIGNGFAPHMWKPVLEDEILPIGEDGRNCIDFQTEFVAQLAPVRASDALASD